MNKHQLQKLYDPTCPRAKSPITGRIRSSIYGWTEDQNRRNYQLNGVIIRVTLSPQILVPFSVLLSQNHHLLPWFVKHSLLLFTLFLMFHSSPPIRSQYEYQYYQYQDANEYNSIGSYAGSYKEMAQIVYLLQPKQHPSFIAGLDG